MNSIHLFAGANSPQGFYSHYRYLAMNNFNRVFILKGGPGTGKSTIIKAIAKHFDCPLEKYHCTADPDSLDGLVIPSFKVSILDGTVPHIVEPLLPGAIQQVIELGHYWNRSALRVQRRKISQLNAEISQQYKTAYTWLSMAARLESMLRAGESSREAEAIAHACLQEILPLLPATAEGFKRKAFATGLTSKGPISFLPMLKAKTTMVLTGGDQAFTELVLGGVARHLHERKIPALYLYCSLRPQHLEHIYIPEEFALFSSHPPHVVEGADKVWGPDRQNSSEQEGQIKYFLEKALAAIAAAAVLHTELEDCYSPHVNFERVSRWPQRIINDILEDGFTGQRFRESLPTGSR